MAKEKAAANLGSLIDLETDPQPQQTQQTDPPKETSNTSTPPSSADKVSSVNLLESLFLDMSTPVVASTETPAATEATSVATVVSSGFGPTVASPESTLALPEPNDSTNGQQTPSITNQHSAVPMGINSSNVQQSTASFDVLYGQVRELCDVS